MRGSETLIKPDEDVRSALTDDIGARASKRPSEFDFTKRKTGPV